MIDRLLGVILGFIFSSIIWVAVLINPKDVTNKEVFEYQDKRYQ